MPLRRKRLHYDWHFFWETGTGDTGNRGVHEMDHTRWLIGRSTLPERVIALGGRFGWRDDGQTPNEHIAFFDCRPVPILWEMKSLPIHKGTKQMPSFRKLIRGGTLIECEGGFMIACRGGARVYDADRKLVRKFPGDAGRGHQANFIKAVRSRKPGDLAAEILEGHLSSAMCHMANVAWHVGARRTPGEIAKAVADRAVLAESADRLIRRLKANAIDLEGRERITLSPPLTIDPKTERFTGPSAAWANMYLSRLYRPPFVVPEKV